MGLTALLTRSNLHGTVVLNPQKVLAANPILIFFLHPFIY